MIFSVLIDHSQCTDEQWAGWRKSADDDVQTFGGRGVVEELCVYASTPGSAMAIVNRTIGELPIRIIYCKAQPHLTRENEIACAEH